MYARNGFAILIYVVLGAVAIAARAQAQSQPNCGLYTGLQQQVCLAYHKSEGQFLKSGNMIYAVNSVSETSSGNVDTWTIIDPPINVPSVSYPQIALQGGDQVQVSAVGCGNHGGNSDTWANSRGTGGGLENQNGQFSPGMLEANVPNTTLGGFDPTGQGMQSWIHVNNSVSVPGSGPVGVLSLGFVDNDYHDNGYYQQYPGYYQECVGWYGFAVTVTITHNEGSGNSSNSGNGTGFAGSQLLANGNASGNASSGQSNPSSGQPGTDPCKIDPNSDACRGPDHDPRDQSGGGSGMAAAPSAMTPSQAPRLGWVAAHTLNTNDATAPRPGAGLGSNMPSQHAVLAMGSSTQTQHAVVPVNGQSQFNRPPPVYTRNPPSLPLIQRVAARVTSRIGAQSCPATVAFTGVIYAQGSPGQSITYHWRRSDGATGPDQRVALGNGNPLVVRDTWTLSQSFRGWERVEIVNPIRKVSNVAQFQLQCAGAQSGAPQHSGSNPSNGGGRESGRGTVSSVIPVGSLTIRGTAVSTVPRAYAGHCPETIAFQVVLYVTGSGNLTYRWIRSDGAATKFFESFVRQSTVRLQQTWTLGTSTQGWEGLQIAGPQGRTIRSPTFNLVCR